MAKRFLAKHSFWTCLTFGHGYELDQLQSTPKGIWNIAFTDIFARVCAQIRILRSILDEKITYVFLSFLFLLIFFAAVVDVLLGYASVN